MSDKLVFGFDKPDADALIRILSDKPSLPNTEDTYDATRLAVAYTTAGATARSGTTLGTGTATLYYLAVSGSDLVLTTQAIDVTFYNMSATAVSATKYLMLLRLGDVFVCNWEDC